jgi:Tol biopolymer transport system component
VSDLTKRAAAGLLVFTLGCGGDGPTELPLTTGDSYNLAPAWLPDSRQIVFHRTTGDGTSTPTIFDGDPSWLPVP